MNQLPPLLRAQLAQKRICRIPVDTKSWILIPTTALPWFEKLEQHGGSLKEVRVREEVLRIATTQIGKPYFNKALPEDTPRLFSCSTLTKWIFAQVGLWLPRYAVDQSYEGFEIADHVALPGSLLFFRNNYPIKDPGREIGHVGILVGEGLMIHGSWQKRQIVQEQVPELPTYVCDPVPREPSLLISLPLNMRGVETALDVARWLQRM